jgi:capsular exopolysaccharide synthesis family protein
MNIQKPSEIADQNWGGAEAGSEDAGGLSLPDFLRVVRVRRKLILGAALSVVALAVVYVSMATPMYSATTVVMLDNRKNSVADQQAVLSGLDMTDPSVVQNQVEILTSVELANRVIDKLKLDQDSEFNPAAGWTAFLKYLNPFNWFPASGNSQAASEGMDQARSALVHSFLGNLSVDPIGLSTAMNVTYVSQDPVKAQRIANAIADEYVEDQLDAKFDATQKATQWLGGRISELSRKAQEADAAVQRYKAEHNITTNATGGSVIDQQTADINSQLVLSKTNLAEKQAAYANLISLARAGRAADSAAAMASPVISALRAQESEIARQLADLSSKYLPGHPKILDLQAQKQNIEAKIGEEVQRIVDSARADVAVASAHVASLQSSLGQLEGQGATQNQAEVGLMALQSAATSARSMYEAFLGRLNQTQDQQGIQTPDARVISVASLPSSPSSPQKRLLVGLAIPAGLILGLMLAFGAERLDSGFRTGQQVEGLLQQPVLAMVPEVKDDHDPSNLIVDKPMSSFAEAIRGLQLGISLSNVDRQPKVIVVTSSVPGEGKTTVAISLARMAAHAGLKAIVMDGDLRRPNVAKTFGVETSTYGLIEAVLGQVPLDQCFGKDPKSDAFILPCLGTPANPADILGSHAMSTLVSSLSQTFDLVVIDSAPMLPVNDTKILSRLSDAVLFVVRWEKTPREAAANALRLLNGVRAQVAGVALTRTDSERFNYYNYGYQNYSNYNKYYSS